MNNIVKERILSEARQAAKRPQREAFNEIVAQKSTNTLKKELIDILLSDIKKEDVATICKRYGWSPSFDKGGNEKPPTQTAMKVAIIKHLIDASATKQWKIAKEGDFIYLLLQRCFLALFYKRGHHLLFTKFLTHQIKETKPILT